MDSKKIIAAAVVALFCFTAYACVVTDDADAASKKYELYVEILGDDHIVSDYVFVYFESEADNEKYCVAANKALADAGYSKVKLEVNSSGGVSVKYDTSKNSSTWYSDGKNWQPVAKMEEDFINNTKAGAAVNGGWINQEAYDELPITEQAYWKEDTQYMPGNYQKVPQVPASGEIKEYKVWLTIISDDLVKTETTTIKFSADNNAAAWVSAFNQATKALGNSVFAKAVAYFDGESYIGVELGDEPNTSSWAKENGKWVSVSETAKQYVADSEIDFELQNGWISADQYNKLSDDQKKNWVLNETMGGYYQRIASASNSSSGDFPIIYVVVAIVAILLIACAAYYLMKNKKTA